MPGEVECATQVDGYYIMLTLGVLGMTIWLACGGNRLMSRLQKIDPSEWRITGRSENTMEKEKLAITERNNLIENKS